MRIAQARLGFSGAHGSRGHKKGVGVGALSRELKSAGQGVRRRRDDVEESQPQTRPKARSTIPRRTRWVRKTKRKVWPWSLWTVGAITLAIAITGAVLIAIALDWWQSSETWPASEAR